MENKKKAAQNPQRDECAATPISMLETSLAIVPHGGLPLLTEDKAQIAPRRANLAACSAEMFSDDKFQPIGYEIF
jgi:hypothetical protein